MIKFPRMHIAASTLNRILNAADDIKRGKSSAPAPAPMPQQREPEMPEGQQVQGLAIDSMLAGAQQEQTPPMGGPGEVANGVAVDVAQGGTALQSILEQLKG